MIEKKFINDLLHLKNSRIIFNLKAMLNVVKKNVAVGKLNYKFKLNLFKLISTFFTHYAKAFQECQTTETRRDETTEEEEEEDEEEFR